MNRRLWIIGAFALLLVSASQAAVTAHRMNDISYGRRGTVLIFVSSQCPCTDQHRQIVNKLLEQTRSHGIAYYCVFSNANESDARVALFYRNIGWDMPYLLDSDGSIAKRVKATNTPQVIAFNAQKDIIYRGPIDDGSQHQGRVEHAYLPDQVNLLLNGGAATLVEVPPLGCWLVTKEQLASQ